MKDSEVIASILYLHSISGAIWNITQALKMTTNVFIVN